MATQYTRLYRRTTWTDFPSFKTPLSSENFGCFIIVYDVNESDAEEEEKVEVDLLPMLLGWSWSAVHSTGRPA
jgi:hypothetical protein